MSQLIYYLFLTYLGSCIPQKGLDSTCNSDNECDDSQMLSCINEKCGCRVGYFKTSKKLCGLAYGQECSKEKVCSDKFICTGIISGVSSDDGYLQETKCLCPNTELEFYDGDLCKGVVGGPCGTEIGCTKNAYCVDKICNCQEGFIEYDRKNCDVAYGHVCEPKNGRSLHLYLSC